MNTKTAPRLTHKTIFLTSVSALAFVSLSTAPAFATAPDTYDTTTNTITNTSGNTNGVVANTVATTGTGNAGSVISGTGVGTFTWNVNADMIADTQIAGFQDTTSAGTHIINFNFSSQVLGGSGGHGVDISSTGTSITTLNINGSSLVQGDTSGSGIFIDSSSSGAVTINIDDVNAVVQNGLIGAAGIDINDSASNSTISNAGLISGGDSAGFGIRMQGDAALSSLLNDTTGTISGGALGSSSHGIDLSTNSGGFGINTLDNYGVISGGNSGGHGINISGDGSITTLFNRTDATIEGGGNDSSSFGINMIDDASIGTLDNDGMISGGDGFGQHGINMAGSSIMTTLLNQANGTIAGAGSSANGITMAGTSSITTLTNEGEVLGGNSSGHGIDLSGTANITSLSNLAGGTIAGSNGGSAGSGINLAGDATIGTLYNNGTVTNLNDSGDGAINLASNTTMTSLTNDVGGVIQGGGNSTAVDIFSAQTVTTFTNNGTIAAGASAGDGIHIFGTAVVGTLDNNGTISATSTTGIGINVTGTGTLTTLNNLEGGTITGGGGDAIVLGTNNSTINNWGVIDGNVVMGGTTDTLNVFSGDILGDIQGAGGFGVVNFDLDDGTFETNGDVGTGADVLDEVNILSGTVELNNDINAANITISSGATLGVFSANQTAAGTFVNDGTLDVGLNQLNIDGDVSGTGLFTLQVNSTIHGLLNSSNGGHDVDVSGMNILPYFDAGDVADGDTLVIVTNPTSTAFDTNKILSLNGIKWTLTEADAGPSVDSQGFAYDDGDLLATASPLTEGVAGPNSDGLNALSFYDGDDPDILALQQALDNTTDNNAAGSQLRPDANGGSQEAALGAVNGALNSILKHLRSSSGMPSGNIPHGVGFWAEGFGSYSTQDTDSNVDGFDATTGGAVFGADRLINDNVRAGVSFAYAHTNVDDDGTREGSGEEIDTYAGTIYGTYTGKPWYMDGALTFADHEYDTTRLVSFGPTVVANGDFGAQQYGAKAEFGYPMPMGGSATITPMVSVAYNYLRQDGYTETGAGGANLVVGSSHTYSLTSGLGAKISTTVGSTSGWLVKPSVRAAWMHEYNDELVQDQNVNYQAGGVAFTNSGLNLPQNAVAFGAGLDLMSKGGVTFSAEYNGQYRSGYMSNGGMLKGRVDF